MVDSKREMRVVTKLESLDRYSMNLSRYFVFNLYLGKAFNLRMEPS